MKRNDKTTWISDLKTSIEPSSTIVVAKYKGLSVADMEELRNKSRENEVSIKVVKNRLTKLALKDSKFEEITPLFEGTTLIAYSEDPINPAKMIADFAKSHKALTIAGGIMDANVLDEAGVKQVANTPSLDESRAKIAALLSTPATRIARVLSENAKKQEEQAAA